MKVFLSMFCLLYAVKANPFENKTKFYKDLFSNYEKKFRPGDNQTIPTELNVSFYIRSLKDFRESNGEIGVVGSLGVQWKDDRLAWNPLDYDDDLNQTSVFVDDIWTPYMVLMNLYEEITPILSGGFSCNVWYDGYVSCLPPPSIFEALCDTYVIFYPKDSKTCKLQLYVSGYYNSDFNFQPKSSTFNSEMYVNTTPWSIDSSRIFVDTIQIDHKIVEILHLEIKLQRIAGSRDVYYHITLILSLMQSCAFLLPIESGESMGFSVAVLLTQVVFFTVVQEKVPESNSESDVPIIVYKQLLDLLMSFFIMFLIAMKSSLYYKVKGEQPLGTEEMPVVIVEQGIGQRLKQFLDHNRKIDYIAFIVCFSITIFNNVIFMLIRIVSETK